MGQAAWGGRRGAGGVGGVEVVAASGCGLERDARGAVEEEVAVSHRHGTPPHLARARARAGGEGEGEGVR